MPVLTGWRIMESIQYMPQSQKHLYVGAFFDSLSTLSDDYFCRLIEIDKSDIRFQHYEAILANPIKAAGNPASAKTARLFAMYMISSPVVEG
jgi:hypothetical protein